MDSPLTKHEQDGKPSFLDVTPERLSKLTASQLADDMERALDFMSDETYDDAVIDAYLEALDRVAPMPEYPDAATTYAEFRDKIRSISEELAPAKSPAVPSCGIRRGRQLLRTVLVAAVLVACLFSGMVVAQASGLDVFARLRAGLPMRSALEMPVRWPRLAAEAQFHTQSRINLSRKNIRNFRLS